MKAHIVTPFFHPVVGGQEVRILELAARLVARGHEVVVHTTARTPDGHPLARQDRVEGVEVRRYAPTVHWGYYLLYWKPVLEPGDEVVLEAQGYPHLMGDAAERAYGSEVPFVMTPVGATIQLHGPAALLKEAYDAALGVPTMRRARRLILLTPKELEWLKAHGISDAKARLVPGAASDEAFEAHDASAARAKFGLDGDFLLLLGRLGVQKDPVALVEAFARIAQDFPDLQVALAGPDEGEGAKAKARAEALGLGERVRLLGRVSDAEKYALLGAAKCLALPSRWEGMPLTVFEAWAQRCPVVVSAVDGIPATVTQNETGLLVPRENPAAMAEALRRVLTDRALAAKLGEAGRAEAEAHHRWGPVARKLEQVYREALDAGPRA
jgi:glycosyltransferase involved in cell wall biosynthesis